MESEEDLLAMFLGICGMYRKCKNQKRRRRLNSDWVVSGYQKSVFVRIREMDSEQFFVQTRMPRPLFKLLLDLVGRDLYKPRQRIGPEERLAMTLHFLAHGTCVQSLAWAYKLGRSTVRKIVLETCEVLWRLLSPVYLSEPTEQQYKDIAKDFKVMWNMPNCVGAIDGKYVAIKCPPNSGSLFHNYKKFFSILLMAASDAKYTFTAVSVGSYGSESDGGETLYNLVVVKSSCFGVALLANRLPLPQSVSLAEESSEPFPHYFVGDAAFPLRTNLMRPYPGVNLEHKKRIFNYRLSRARRVTENSFGILTARWRVLRSTMEFSPENTERFVLACLVLHNFIMLNDHARWYCPEKCVDWEGPDQVMHDGNWRMEDNNTSIPLRPIVSSQLHSNDEMCLRIFLLTKEQFHFKVIWTQL